MHCEFITHRPRWRREGGEDRAIGLSQENQYVCICRREERKGDFFSLGHCKLLAFGSQCQVFLLHY